MYGQALIINNFRAENPQYFNPMAKPRANQHQLLFGAVSILVEKFFKKIT
jgi:hypothetical protein